MSVVVCGVVWCGPSPPFKQLATHFAALHDTPGVMLHKRAIREIVPWAQARGFFASRLRMRVAEERVKTLVGGCAQVKLS